MANSHSDYQRGDMQIEDQRTTFDGFMNLTVYGGGLIALALLMAILTVGGVGLGWLPALIITTIVGILAGILLKLRAVWYATVIILAGITGLFCFVIGLFV